MSEPEPATLPSPSDHGRFWRLGAALLSGLLMASAFSPMDFSWAGWIALTPLAIAVICAPAPGSPSRRFIWQEGFLLGSAFFFPSLFWVTEVSGIGWLALSAYMSCFPALWVRLLHRILSGAVGSLHSARNLQRAALAASAWIALEWLRGLLFTGFPWNFLGVSQWKMVAVIQIAEWGGVLLVSWLVVFTSLVLALTIVRVVREGMRQQRLRPHFEFTLGMMLLGLVLLYGIHELFRRDEPRTSLRVLAVQPDIPQDPWGSAMPTDEALAKMEVLTRSGLAVADRVIDLVVWPETPVGDEIFSHPSFHETWQTTVQERNTALLIGSIVVAGPDLYNAALLYPPGGAAPQIYYKQHLVVMGEVIPLPAWLRSRMSMLDQWIALGQNFSSGTSATVFRSDGVPVRIAPLICFEDVFGRVARRFARGNPDLLINITNDGWFARSPQSRQHLANAVFRAIENRMPLLRVSNNGVTAMVDQRGAIQPQNMIGSPGSPSLHEAGTMIWNVPIPNPRATFYQRFGDWPGPLSVVVVVAWALWSMHSSGRLKFPAILIRQVPHRGL